MGGGAVVHAWEDRNCLGKPYQKAESVHQLYTKQTGSGRTKGRGGEKRREERMAPTLVLKKTCSKWSQPISFSLSSQIGSGKEECYFSAACLATVTLVTFPNLSLPSYRRHAEARALL